jgi:hypothetical protein
MSAGYLGLALCGILTAPQRSWVSSIGVKLNHRVEQLARGVGRRIEADEVLQILPPDPAE